MYLYQDGELLTAAKLNQSFTEVNTDISKLNENKIRVNGAWYEKTGEQTANVTSYLTLANSPINYATIEVPFPFYPPAGYRFLYEQPESGSTLSFIITSGQTVSKRVTKLYFIQLGGAATGAKRLFWRLEKIA